MGDMIERWATRHPEKADALADWLEAKAAGLRPIHLGIAMLVVLGLSLSLAYSLA